MPLRRPSIAAVLAAAAVVLTGCGDLSADDVESAARAFAAAEDDAEVRCDLLAPSTLAALVQEESAPCDEVIGDVPIGTGDVMSVEVWGEEAQARLADDTLFLTRTSAGWRVMAAACTSQGEAKPYDCELEGS
jgi:hypothetical protein